ncbi:MAG: hypothetical protein NTV54_08715 [Ignavibacteriales bacterium]|nr:hypothetical protein [Ignavibacteriales bacterium]
MIAQPSSWNDDIAVELARARQAEQENNAGRVRTCARRMAGIALMYYFSRSGDVMGLLRAAMTTERLPEAVRAAAERLQERIHSDFSTILTDPLGDAMTIINFVAEKKS